MREGEGGWPGKGGGGGGSPVLLMPFSQPTWLDGSTLRRCHGRVLESCIARGGARREK